MPEPPEGEWISDHHEEDPCPLDLQQQEEYHAWLDRQPAEAWPLDTAELIGWPDNDPALAPYREN